ncbi:MAG TPA: hypothetical protein VGQ73_07700 [Gemmatimonadales bacterium]|jgi:hypothetical protein|nr:hypothetical protein [Gemmatimonadales bacterium]
MPSSTGSAAPFTVESIHFAYPGNPDSIPLRDPMTLEFLGASPEWTAAGQRRVIACVRGRRPLIRVTFARSARGARPDGRWRVRAAGEGGPGIAERLVTLKFDRRGRSGPHEFRLAAPLPAGIGTLDLYWQWEAGRAGSQFQPGLTRHRFHLAWREPIAPAVWAALTEPKEGPPGEPARPWVYLPLMQWTCEWAKSSRGAKEICDAILARVRESGLQYAPLVPAYTVQDMLTGAGGYCFGWYHLFQAMAAAQGVRLERRTYATDWREQPRGEARWCAIVVEAAGVNRSEPLEEASTFHDVKRRPVATSRIDREHQRRYRFWGVPGLRADGHCINFLKYRGRWLLYDACFRTEPVALRGFALPVPNVKRPISVERLGNFKAAYLQGAVPFMLGSLLHSGKLLRTVHPTTSSGRTRNGATLKTQLIPKRDAQITFYWTE